MKQVTREPPGLPVPRYHLGGSNPRRTAVPGTAAQVLQYQTRIAQRSMASALFGVTAVHRPSRAAATSSRPLVTSSCVQSSSMAARGASNPLGARWSRRQHWRARCTRWPRECRVDVVHRRLSVNSLRPTHAMASSTSPAGRLAWAGSTRAVSRRGLHAGSASTGHRMVERLLRPLGAHDHPGMGPADANDEDRRAEPRRTTPLDDRRPQQRIGRLAVGAASSPPGRRAAGTARSASSSAASHRCTCALWPVV